MLCADKQGVEASDMRESPQFHKLLSGLEDSECHLFCCRMESSCRRDQKKHETCPNRRLDRGQDTRLRPQSKLGMGLDKGLNNRNRAVPGVQKQQEAQQPPTVPVLLDWLHPHCPYAHGICASAFSRD